MAAQPEDSESPHFLGGLPGAGIGGGSGGQMWQEPQQAQGAPPGGEVPEWYNRPVAKSNGTPAAMQQQQSGDGDVGGAAGASLGRWPDWPGSGSAQEPPLPGVPAVPPSPPGGPVPATGELPAAPECPRAADVAETGADAALAAPRVSTTLPVCLPAPSKVSLVPVRGSKWPEALTAPQPAGYEAVAEALEAACGPGELQRWSEQCVADWLRATGATEVSWLNERGDAERHFDITCRCPPEDGPEGAAAELQHIEVRWSTADRPGELVFNSDLMEWARAHRSTFRLYIVTAIGMHKVRLWRMRQPFELLALRRSTFTLPPSCAASRPPSPRLPSPVAVPSPAAPQAPAPPVQPEQLAPPRDVAANGYGQAGEPVEELSAAGATDDGVPVALPSDAPLPGAPSPPPLRADTPPASQVPAQPKGLYVPPRRTQAADGHWQQQPPQPDPRHQGYLTGSPYSQFPPGWSQPQAWGHGLQNGAAPQQPGAPGGAAAHHPGAQHSLHHGHYQGFPPGSSYYWPQQQGWPHSAHQQQFAGSAALQRRPAGEGPVAPQAQQRPAHHHAAPVQPQQQLRYAHMPQQQGWQMQQQAPQHPQQQWQQDAGRYPSPAT